MSLKTSQQQILEGWQLYTAPFGGYRTQKDSSLDVMKKYFPAGQNCSVSENGSIAVRQGSEVIGGEGTTTATPIRTSYTFKKRNGDEIELRTFGTRVEWRHPDTAEWNLLRSVTTTDLIFGFATVNVNANATSFLYFCNGGTGANDDLWRWNGALARVASNTATTVTKQGTTTWAAEGFSATGTVSIDGTDYAYTGGTDTTTLTGLAALPSLTVGEPVTEAVTSILDPVTYANTLGNILLAVGSRLFMAGITGRESTIRYSQFTNPENFGADASPTDPSTVAAIGTRLAGAAGLIELPEGGGPIINLLQFKKQVLAAKTNGWTRIFFTDPSDNRTGATSVFAGDYPVIETLYAQDGRSQIVGAISRKLVFAGNNGIFAVTQDRRIVFLTEIENILTPQFVDISDEILPTLRLAVFNRGAGIFFEGKAYFSCRSSSVSTRNDTVFVYDLNSKTWDTPYIGISAGDWTITGNTLRWGNDNNDTSHAQLALDAGRTDTTLGFTSSITTHIDNFGVRHKPKTIDAIWLEGFMTQNTVLEVELLYDRGVTAIQQYKLRGTDEEVFALVPTDAFGLSVFGGNNPFGSGVEQANLRHFKYQIPVKPNQEAFEFQLRLTSTVVGSNWEIQCFGYHVAEVLPQNRVRLKTT